MTELELGPLRFGVVGAGRLGCAMARALQQRGFDVVHASSETTRGREHAARLLQVPVHEDPIAATQQVDCVLLCVPDDALEAVVRQLARRPDSASPMQLRVVGTSAHGGLAALEPLAAAGHSTGVLHPVASVSERDGDPAVLAGAGAAVGAADAAERTLLHALAHALGMHPFDLAEEAWASHAAACTLAANGPAALLAAADDLAHEAGLHAGIARSAYGRLAATAVDRAVREGAVTSLAGPIMRGDAAALAAQVAAVRASSSEVDALFIPVVATIANRAFTSGRLDMRSHRELLEAILDPTQFEGGSFRHPHEGDPSP